MRKLRSTPPNGGPRVLFYAYSAADAVRGCNALGLTLDLHYGSDMKCFAVVRTGLITAKLIDLPYDATAPWMPSRDARTPDRVLFRTRFTTGYALERTVLSDGTLLDTWRIGCKCLDRATLDAAIAASDRTVRTARPHRKYLAVPLEGQHRAAGPWKIGQPYVAVVDPDGGVSLSGERIVRRADVLRGKAVLALADRVEQVRQMRSSARSSTPIAKP